MRGGVTKQATMLSLVGPEQRVPKNHPIRRIKALADEQLESLSPVFDNMYAEPETAETVSKDSKRGTRAGTEDLELAHWVYPARRSARGGGGMGWPSRMFQEEGVYFVTSRCFQGQLLLPPTAPATAALRLRAGECKNVRHAFMATTPGAGGTQPGARRQQLR